MASIELTSSARELSKAETAVVDSLMPLSEYLEAAVAADLTGDGGDEIVILVKEFDSVTEDGQPAVSGIFKIENGRARYLVHFPPEYTNFNPLVADLNADGVFDLVYTAFTGGNAFGSSPLNVAWWDGNAFQIQGIGELKDFYDFDGDGSLEIETTYEMPGLSECGWGCDPGMASLRKIQYAPSVIWEWGAKDFVDVTTKVPEFFREVRIPALETRRADMEAAWDECATEACKEVLPCLLECLEMVEERARGFAGEE